MDSLIEQFPETVSFSDVSYKSQIFQPERISLNSSDNSSQNRNPFYYSQFLIRLIKPCVGVKSTQLLRASFPTPIPSLPENSLVFWYYRYPNASVPTSSTQLSTNYLYFIRLNPSWSQPEILGTNYGYNRSFTDYNDLVSELNIAANNE